VQQSCQHELFVKDILLMKFLGLEIGVIKLSDMNIFFRKIKDKRMSRDCKSTHGYNKRIKQFIKVSTTEHGPITFWNAQTTDNKNERSLVLITASSLTNYSYACNNNCKLSPIYNSLLTMASLLQHQITQEAKLKALHKQREANKQIGINRKSRKESDNEVQIQTVCRQQPSTECSHAH